MSLHTQESPIDHFLTPPAPQQPMDLSDADIARFEADMASEAAEHLLTEAAKAELIERLYRDNYAELYKQARNLTGNSSDAEDNVQECFVRAFRSVDRFVDKTGDGHAPWLTWLNRNVFLDSLRRKSARAQEQLVDTTPANLAVLSATRHDPFETAAGTEAVEAATNRLYLAQLMLKLTASLGDQRKPREEREGLARERLVQLYLISIGYTKQEIADMRGAAYGTVQSGTHRFLQEAKSYIQDNPAIA